MLFAFGCHVTRRPVGMPRFFSVAALHKAPFSAVQDHRCDQAGFFTVCSAGSVPGAKIHD
jgi:hypothetical protein